MNTKAILADATPAPMTVAPVFPSAGHWIEHHGLEVVVILFAVVGIIWVWNKFVAPRIITYVKMAADYLADHGMQAITVILLVIAIHMMYTKIIPPDFGWSAIGGSILPWLYAMKKKKTGDAVEAKLTADKQEVGQTLDWQNEVLKHLLEGVGKPIGSPGAPGPPPATTTPAPTDPQGPPPGSPAAAETPKVTIGGPPKQF